MKTARFTLAETRDIAALTAQYNRTRSARIKRLISRDINAICKNAQERSR